jgi:hypothetical protein
LDFARNMGRDVLLHDLGGVYKIFLIVVSPEYMLSKAPLVFGSYYDTGKMEVVEHGKRYARAVFSGCTGFDRNLWDDMIGSCEGALMAAGAVEPFSRVLRGGGTVNPDEDPDAEMEMRWR